MNTHSNSILKKIIMGSGWSFLGVLLTLLFFYLSEYRNQFEFRIEIIDNFNLVEVKEQIEDLKILYKDEDILTSDKQIRVMRIRLRNTGKTILQQYYDQLEPFGLQFKQGKILSVDIVNSNSEDIRKKILPSKAKRNVVSEEVPEATDDELYLSKVIFEKGDFITFKIFLIQNKDDDLTIVPIGKIANVESIKVVGARKPAEEVEENLGWSWRDFAFSIAFITLLVSVMIGIEHIIKIKKKRRVDGFLLKHGALTEAQEGIVDIYLNKWNKSFDRLFENIVNSDGGVDLDRYIKRGGPFSLLRNFSLIFHLPYEIFHREGNTVSLNKHNEDFIKKFLAEVGLS